MRRASSATATAGMVATGIILGAGLVLGTLYLSGSIPAKAVTQTIVQTSTATIFSATTFVSTSTLVSTTTFISTFYSTSGQNLRIVEVQCSHTAGTLKMGNSTLTASLGDSCLVALTNTGGSAGAITGYTIDDATGTLRNGPATVPAGTTSSNPVIIECDSALGLIPGAAVTGSILVASGSPLPFSAIAGS